MNTTAIPDSAELRALYQELILDHARKPRHFGKLETATHTAQGINPLCGDKLRLFLQLDSDEQIVAASFAGSGCAISLASASMLTEAVIGMRAQAALDVSATMTAQLTSHSNTDAPLHKSGKLDKLRALYGVRQFPARVKCATLAWHALESAIHQQAAPATTE